MELTLLKFMCHILIRAPLSGDNLWPDFVVRDAPFLPELLLLLLLHSFGIQKLVKIGMVRNCMYIRIRNITEKYEVASR